MTKLSKAKEGFTKAHKTVKSCVSAAFSRFRDKTIFSIKPQNIWLYIRLYSLISIKFVKRFPTIFKNGLFEIYIFVKTLPRRIKRDESRILIYGRPIELKDILPHLGLAIVASVIFFSNTFAKDMGFHSKRYLGDNIEPSEIADLAMQVDSFTPYILESENGLILSFADTKKTLAYEDSHIVAPVSLTTEISPKESIPVQVAERTQYIAYQVLGGETLSLVGAKFGVTSQTILWANPDIKNPDIIQPGTVLFIPPCNGITHIVQRGEGLASIVSNYGGNYALTLEANGIGSPDKIYAGNRIIIPGGKPKQTPKVAAAKKSSVRGVSSPTGPTIPSGTFIWPTRGTVCQRFRRGHPAIDICAGGSSPPIVASDGGRVVEAKYGWNWGYGNTVLIDHGSGRKTRYAHLRSLSVRFGQYVSKGQLLGYMGTTGNSTGIHLHFEIHLGPTRVNPLAYLR